MKHDYNANATILLISLLLLTKSGAIVVGLYTSTDAALEAELTLDN